MLVLIETAQRAGRSEDEIVELVESSTGDDANVVAEATPQNESRAA